MNKPEIIHTDQPGKFSRTLEAPKKAVMVIYEGKPVTTEKIHEIIEILKR